MSRLEVAVGALPLKNPVICGSGEHTMTADSIRAALRAGVGAVVAKSVNESAAAKQQLDRTDYALLGSDWQRLPWDFAPPADAHLLCRSGLIQLEFETWMEQLVALDREAAAQGSYVIPSLILSDLDQCARYARAIEQMGLRVLEVNIGAPHGEEAARGAIVLERSGERIATIVRTLRAATRLPLWIKLTGQSEDVAALADAARQAGADAVVMMGRFMGFLPDLDSEAPMLGTSAALGGGWALPLTARWVALSRKRLGPDYPLLATNGARSGYDVARFLLAGACATEMTSAVFTGGYEVLARSVRELDEYLQHRGRTAVQLLGVAADRLASYADQASRPGYWQTFVPPAAF